MTDFYPLIILCIGIVSIVAMITFLRLNAFISLITSAVIVSLLAPGSLGEKISRVAEAFGSAAGKIGIVIALAVVIGKCMMDSGAADRIVRAFLRLLGEKRVSIALMSSGFVLSIPVFFDTVFYLLVPLARSEGNLTPVCSRMCNVAALISASWSTLKTCSLNAGRIGWMLATRVPLFLYSILICTSIARIVNRVKAVPNGAVPQYQQAVCRQLARHAMCNAYASI